MLDDVHFIAVLDLCVKQPITEKVNNLQHKHHHQHRVMTTGRHLCLLLKSVRERRVKVTESRSLKEVVNTRSTYFLQMYQFVYN